MKYRTIRNRITFYRLLSNLISYLLHPLVMPTLIFAIVLYFCPMAVNVSPQMIKRLLVMIFITTFVFPFLSTLVLFYAVKKSLSFSDLQMDDHKDRFYPFLFTGFFYSAITYMFIQSAYDPNLVAIMGGISLSVLLISVISYFYKISAHSVGICGVFGYTLIISYFYPYEWMLYPIAGVALLAGLLMSARLFLKAHTPNQVFTGGLLGIVISMLSFVVFKKFGYLFLF